MNRAKGRQNRRRAIREAEAKRAEETLVAAARVRGVTRPRPWWRRSSNQGFVVEVSIDIGRGALMTWTPRHGFKVVLP
jgi:hypothetical protein